MSAFLPNLRLHQLDLVVLAAYFIAVGVIGYLARSGAREENTRGYLLGNRKIPWWAVLFSIIGTELSALTFVGVPALAYTGNWTYLQLALGAILARVIVSRFFVRAYYYYEVVSIYEFLLKRFGQWTRNLGVIVFLCTRILMSGVRLYAGALIVKLGFGVSTETAIFVIAVVAVLYTVAGGIKAVIWTEVLQVAVMFTGAFISLGLILTHIPGGLVTVFAQAGDKFQLLSFSLNPAEEFTIWSAVIGTTIGNTAVFGTDYDMVQRMLTAKDSKKSSLAVIGSGLADVPIAGLFLLIGTCLYVFYKFHPDPTLPAPKEIFPHFILTQMPAGIAGLVTAGVLSTVLSTYESALNSLAGSFVVDLYRPYIAPNRNEGHYVTVTRWVMVLFCLAMMFVATKSQNVDKILEFGLEVGTYTYGALLAVFAVGLFTKKGSDRGCALSVPFAILAVLVVKSQTELTFPWFVTIGASVGFVCSLLFSELLPPRSGDGEYRVVTEPT